jgi:hypothetical protein
MKYYYDDPLAAAWMVKHFGMRFELVMFNVDTKNVVHHLCSPELFVEWPRLNLDTERFGLNYYIHPGDHHLLDPIPGDLVRRKTDGICYVCVDEKALHDGWGVFAAPSAAYYGRTDSYQSIPFDALDIIQRNGKAFIIPKQEDLCNTQQ